MNWILTEADLQLTEAFRLSRMRGLFSELCYSTLYLDLEYVLNIYAADEETAIDLAEESVFKAVQQQAYIVLGCRHIKLWLEKQLIATAEIDLESANTCNEADDMVTLERPLKEIAVATAAPTATTNLPGQTIAAIAEDTEQSIETVRAWILEQGWMVIPFKDEQIITGEVADAAIDHFGALLIQQRKAKRGLLGATPAKSTSDDDTAPSEVVRNGKNGTHVENEISQTSTRATIRGLAIPTGYEGKITKVMRTNLDRALPADKEARAGYLSEINSGSERGLRFVERLATLIVKKTKLPKEKVQQGLIDSAKKMQA